MSYVLMYSMIGFTYPPVDGRQYLDFIRLVCPPQGSEGRAIIPPPSIISSHHIITINQPKANTRYCVSSHASYIHAPSHFTHFNRGEINRAHAWKRDAIITVLMMREDPWTYLCCLLLSFSSFKTSPAAIKPFHLRLIDMPLCSQ
jgi:hypothetical protein